MPFKDFDTSGNSDQGRILGEIKQMLKELYDLVAPKDEDAPSDSE